MGDQGDVTRAERIAAGDLAERMVPVAARLVGAVHDDGRDGVAEVLALVGPQEWAALAIVLAAMVHPDESPGAALGWVRWDEFGAALPGGARPPRRGPRTPAGDRTSWSAEVLREAHAAYARGERSPEAVTGEREYQRRRGVRRREQERADRGGLMGP